MKIPPPIKQIEFHGEIIYYVGIQDALEHTYRRGRHEGYGEGYKDGKEFTIQRIKLDTPYDAQDQ